jgi:hypothetical protein
MFTPEMPVWYISEGLGMENFGSLLGHFGIFVAILVSLLYQEKSGNPV